MHQNDAVKVMPTPRLRASSGASPSRTRRQLEVRKTVCDRVSTKTMVAMLAVRMPIGTSSRWSSASVSRQAPAQEASVPTTGGQER